MVMLRMLVIWSSAICLVTLTAVHAVGMVYKTKQPFLAIALFPDNGIAYGKAADSLWRSAAIANDNKMPESLPADAITFARRAYLSEPTSVEAVHTLALQLDQQGRREDARKLMRLSTTLTKRSSTANLWLAEDFGRHGDLDELLRHYDWTLRSNSSSGDFLYPIMAEGLAQSSLIEPYAVLLSSDPPWLEKFWPILVRTKNTQVIVASLRQQLSGAAALTASSEDEALLGMLINNRNWDEAHELYIHLASSSAIENGDQIIKNGDYSRSPSLLPFDWETPPNAEFVASIDDSRGQLVIDATAGSSGVAATQIIRLDNGRYSLTAKLGEPVPPGNELRLDVRCVQQSQRPNLVASKRVDKLENKWIINLNQIECSYFIIRWLINVSTDVSASEVVIDSISLKRLN